MTFDWTIGPGFLLGILVLIAVVGGGSLAYEQVNSRWLDELHAQITELKGRLAEQDRLIDKLTTDFRDYRQSNNLFQAEQRQGIADLSKILSTIQVNQARRKK